MKKIIKDVEGRWMAKYFIYLENLIVVVVVHPEVLQ